MVLQRKLNPTTIARPTKVANHSNRPRKIQPAQSLHEALVRHHHTHYTAPYEARYSRREDVAQLESLARQYQRYPKSEECYTYTHVGLSQTKSEDGERVGICTTSNQSKTPCTPVLPLLPPTEKDYKKKTMDY